MQNRLQIPLLQLGIMPHLIRQPLLGRLLSRSIYGDVAADAYVEQTRLGMLEHDMKRSLPILRAQMDEDWYPGLSRIALPTVVLCGDRDRTCLPWHSERLGRDIPNARNVWLPGVGHMVPFEAPESILAHVSELAGV